MGTSKKKFLLVLAGLGILITLLVRLDGSRTLTRADAILSTLLLLICLLALATCLWAFCIVRHFVLLVESDAF